MISIIALIIVYIIIAILITYLYVGNIRLKSKIKKYKESIIIQRKEIYRLSGSNITTKVLEDVEKEIDKTLEEDFINDFYNQTKIERL